ncbi:hypothetical protein BJ085DRAFT_36285 [Dimargaris cristalligena]|uniref:Uncharacterized protein n=1 Tax=Dimargaris cristalligena TaxID=215637 RepID=A0A4P9ZVR3_9FUNG|nr:hypothetical protein BJ085DRAFT_36285 [Dimargaris cristalligena]|eukprot:RKP37368.1 hypothetical protein BJ085DRAFT_36285 [Dimargaris cristalligena]
MFSGLILLTKSYYASNFNRKILYPLAVSQTATIVVLSYALSQITVYQSTRVLLCEIKLKQSSFLTAMSMEFVLNFSYSALFLFYIYQANLQFDSSLYSVLFRDGMIYWLITSIFPVIIGMAAFIPTLARNMSTLVVFYSKYES